VSARSLLGLILAALMLSPSGVTWAEEAKTPFVRIAELTIDPAQLESYKAAVREEMETSIRTEPGVLAIYSVALKDDSSQLRFFEIYQDEAAYRAHRRHDPLPQAARYGTCAAQREEVTLSRRPSP
jgi:quinol monooxygenase YgiN